jgi:hypothetical protein
VKVILTLALVFFTTLSEACFLRGGARFQIDEQTVVYARFSDSAPLLSEHFSLYLLICKNDQPWSPTTLKIDAIMPDHGHGMNYRPEIIRVDPGRYEVHGLLLHMPGKWQFDVDLKQNGNRQKVQFDIRL